MNVNTETVNGLCWAYSQPVICGFDKATTEIKSPSSDGERNKSLPTNKTTAQFLKVYRSYLLVSVQVAHSTVHDSQHAHYQSRSQVSLLPHLRKLEHWK